MAPSPYPLSVNRIFTLGWSMYRFSWRQMLGAVALCLVPAYLVTVPIAALFSPRIDEWLNETQRATQLNLPQPERPPNFEVAIISLAITAIVLLVASLVATAALVRIVDAVFRGARVGALAAVRDALGRLMSLLAGQLLYFVGVAIILMLGLSLAAALIVGGGLLAFVGLIALVGSLAGVLFFAVRAYLMTQAIVIERIGGAEGLSRSWRLVAGSGWRVLGYIILLSLLSVLIGVAISLPAAILRATGTSFADYAVRGLFQALIAILLTPLAPVVLTLLYFDLRWRHGENVPQPGGGEVQGRAQP